MASPPPHLVPFLLLAMAHLSAPQDVSDGAAMMDGQELLGLFEVMGTLLEDPNWAQLHPHPCTDTPWPGIQCEVGQEQDPTFHVTKLHVGPDVVNPPCKTSAILSQSLLKLPYLKTLPILSCFLTTPASLSSSLFGPISSLEQIVFKSNPSLSGEIPTTFSQIPRLRVLSLSQNNLHGGIPKELGGLAGLEELDLGYNHLTGEIPQEIGGLASLAILDLCWNDLQGNVPPTIGNLLSLQKMDLSYNNLVGSVPPDMGHLHRLVLLDLSHNFLSGPIPETLSGLKELEYFLLADNPINTRIPLFLGTVEKLTVVSLSGCGLTGQIPTSFSSLAHLTALSLDRNGLSGPVPQNLGALPHLGQLNLSQNRLSGELSFPQDFVHRLGKRLDVRGNKGLCIRNHIYENMSMYLDLDSPACLDSDQSSSGPWEQGTGADDKRLKPAWFDGKGSSDASDVYGGLVLQWSMGCNLIVILMGFL
ncbi:receptor like protein 29-like [Magnolia sinica]|uniref:receptor like protein 29-like n=1 Tax=Magnolia sinica TaxID=86752 RepID=UPI002659EEBA|nr:receptor like protein 29-like [Magnolia sinica]